MLGFLTGGHSEAVGVTKAGDSMRKGEFMASAVKTASEPNVVGVPSLPLFHQRLMSLDGKERRCHPVTSATKTHTCLPSKPKVCFRSDDGMRR